MIWDRVAPLYDLAVNTLNRRVYYGLFIIEGVGVVCGVRRVVAG